MVLDLVENQTAAHILPGQVAGQLLQRQQVCFKDLDPAVALAQEQADVGRTAAHRNPGPVEAIVGALGHHLLA